MFPTARHVWRRVKAHWGPNRATNNWRWLDLSETHMRSPNEATHAKEGWFQTKCMLFLFLFALSPLPCLWCLALDQPPWEEENVESIWSMIYKNIAGFMPHKSLSLITDLRPPVQAWQPPRLGISRQKLDEHLPPIETRRSHWRSYLALMMEGRFSREPHLSTIWGRNPLLACLGTRNADLTSSKAFPNPLAISSR